MPKRISPVALETLKEALAKIYWYKKELKRFMTASLGQTNLLSVANWEDDYKIKIVSDIIEYLASDQDKYLAHLERLIHDVCEIKTFAHLEKLEDGETRAKAARQAVQSLKVIFEGHESIIKSEKETAKLREESARERNSAMAFQSKLEGLKNTYTAPAMSKDDPQQRGRDLEELMYNIFNLFDLDAKASFSLKGEQIDGAFSLDGTDYLFESKWHQRPVSRADMDAFSAKVTRKLENTLGLFLSINGFSQDGIDIYSNVRASFILMTGADLMAVVDGRIDFLAMLVRKRRHASQTGKVLLEVSEF